MLIELTKVTKNKEFDKEIVSKNNFYYDLFNLESNIYLILHLAENYDPMQDYCYFTDEYFKKYISFLGVKEDPKKHFDGLDKEICSHPKHDCWTDDHNFVLKFKYEIKNIIEKIKLMEYKYNLMVDKDIFELLYKKCDELLEYQFEFIDEDHEFYNEDWDNDPNMQIILFLNKKLFKRLVNLLFITKRMLRSYIYRGEKFLEMSNRVYVFNIVEKSFNSIEQ